MSKSLHRRGNVELGVCSAESRGLPVGCHMRAAGASDRLDAAGDGGTRDALGAFDHRSALNYYLGYRGQLSQSLAAAVRHTTSKDYREVCRWGVTCGHANKSRG